MGKTRAVEGTRISAWDGHRSVLLLARCSLNVVYPPLNWWAGSAREAGLLDLWRGGVDFDGRRLESEGLGVQYCVRLRVDKLGAGAGESFFSGGRGVVGGWWEAWGLDVLRVRWGERTEARGVGSGLRAQLGEVEIRAGAVTDVHGLAKTLLGVVSVEDDGVEEDGDALQDDFNEAANQRPRLELPLVAV